MVGINYGGTISQSYSTASVSSTGTFNGPAFVGGLIGWNQNSSVLQDVYAFGSVNGPGFTYTGGLIGFDTAGLGAVSRAYAAGGTSGGFFTGGLTGRGAAAPYINVYWDLATTGQTVSSGLGGPVGTGISDAQLLSGLPTGFSSSVWGSSPTVNLGYPFLLWQTAAPPPPSFTTLIGAAPFLPSSPPLGSIRTKLLELLGAVDIDRIVNAVNSNIVVTPTDPLALISQPAVEQILSINLRPFINLLPVNIRSPFQVELKKAVLDSLENSKVTSLIGKLTLLNILIGDVVDHYIQIATSNVADTKGPIAAGAMRFALQTASNTVMNFLSAVAIKPSILENPLTIKATVVASLGVGATQAAITNLVDLALALTAR